MLLLRGLDVWQIDCLNEKKIHLWTVLDSYPKAELPPMSHRMHLPEAESRPNINAANDGAQCDNRFCFVDIIYLMESCCQEKGSITDIASASALTKTSETSAGTASFAEGSAQGMAQVQYKSDINADPSSMNTIRRTERNSQANISGWIVRNEKNRPFHTMQRQRIETELKTKRLPTTRESTQPLWLDPLPYSGNSKKQNPDPFKARL